MGSDLVSICIPAYNAEKTIESTLQSILNQSYRNLEIIIVDNASTDSTLSIVQRFKDPRTRIYRNERNIGAEKNWNKCLELASGEYIAIFHADDIYLPDIIKEQVLTFRNNPTIGAVFALAKNINEQDKVISHRNLPSELRGKKIYYLSHLFLSILINGNFLTCPSCIVKSKLYKELAPFDYDRFGTSSDLDMWLRILEKCPVAILEKELMCYRISSSQGSYQFNHSRTEEANFFKVMDFHLASKSTVLNIPRNALEAYEFRRSRDMIARAVNHLVNANPKEAKILLKKSLFSPPRGSRISIIRRSAEIIYWISGVILLGLIYLRLDSILRKGLHRFYFLAGKFASKIS